ncbi:MAG: substrate-binding periplasmic protein [Roseateles sp.]
MRPILFALIASAWLSPARAEELRFVQDMSTSPPFIVAQRDAQGRERVVGGLLYDLSRLLAGELGRDARFMPTPRKRLESTLQSGEGDLLCYMDPAWLVEPDKLDWSGVFLRNENLLVARPGLPLPARLEDLQEGHIGAVAGYVYPEFQGRLGVGKLQRDDAPNDGVNLRKLAAGRADYLITHRLYLDHMLRAQPELRQAVGGRLEIRRFETRCAVSRRGRVTVAEVDAALQRLQRSGRWGLVLTGYR